MNTKIDYKVFETFPTLEGKRIVCRAFTLDDAQSLFELRSNPITMEFMDSTPHQHIDDSKQMIERCLKSFQEKKGIAWVITERESGEFVGDFSFWRLDPDHCRGEIGYALLPNFMGKGYMQETFDLILAFAFSQLKLHSIEANVNPQNKKSALLLERNGFRKEAHFRENYLYNGKFLDSHIYCLIESDRTD